MSVLLIASSTILLFGGCGRETDVSVSEPQIQAQSSESIEENTVVPVTEVAPVENPPSPNFLQDALTLGMKAAQLAQFAQDSADWKTVNITWLAAIEKLKSVPTGNQDYEVAQQKISEYQSNADVAAKKVQNFVSPQATQQQQKPNNPQISFDQVIDKYNEQFCAEVQKIIAEETNVYDWTEDAIHLKIIYPLLPSLQDIEDITGQKIADAEFRILAKNKRQC